MSEVTLTAKAGREPGSRASGRLRAVGHVPAVVYGHGITPLPVAIDWRDLRAALTTDAGSNALINLSVGTETHLTVVRDMQRHPIKHDVLHVDFQVVSRDQVISVDVPIVVTGESEHVNGVDGATVEQNIHSLTVNTKPGDIPNELIVDISGLEVGSSIRVGDLPLPAGVTTDHNADDPIVTATVITVELEAAEVAEEGGEPGEAPTEDVVDEATGAGEEPGEVASDDSADATEG